MSDLEARDLLEQDMASHERRFNGEVHADRNQSLAAEALEQLDREKREAERRARWPASQHPNPPTERDARGDAGERFPEAEEFTQRRELNGHTYIIDKAPDTTPMYRQATDFERNVLAHALPRIKLLLSKPESGPLGTPSWRMRTLAACYFKTKAHEARTSGLHDDAEIFERCYQQDLHELLEASNQAFGDWRKTPDKPLVVQV